MKHKNYIHFGSVFATPQGAVKTSHNQKKNEYSISILTE